MSDKDESHLHSSQTGIKKHERFYFDNITIRVESSAWGIRNEGLSLMTLVTQVEDSLFNVPLRPLRAASPIFDSMVVVGKGDQGKTDDNPVVLEGQTSKDFESLLKVIFPE
jgi:hypothetical protein